MNIQLIKQNINKNYIIKHKVIDTFWNELWKKNKVYNWKLFNINKIEHKEKQLSIIGDDAVDYKTLVWIRNNLNVDNYYPLINTLSLFCPYITIDNQVVLWKRKNIGDWENTYELSGWFVTYNDLKNNIHNIVIKKLKDDYFNINKKHINIKFTKHYEQKEILETTLLFNINWKLKKEDFIKNIKHKYSDLIFIENNKDAITNFLENNSNIIHKPSIKALKNMFI